MADCKFKIGDRVDCFAGAGVVSGIRSFHASSGELFECDVEHDVGGHSWVAESGLTPVAKPWAEVAPGVFVVESGSIEEALFGDDADGDNEESDK